MKTTGDDMLFTADLFWIFSHSKKKKKNDFIII